MTRILRRFALGLATVAAVYVLTFVMVMVVPGNPFSNPERNMSPEVLKALEARYNINDPVKYFFEFLAGAIRLDFGPSFQYKDWTCSQIIADALPVSMTLGFAAILLAVLVGVPVGVLSAVHRNRWFNLTTMGLILLGISLPTFVTGSALLIVFAVFAHWFPIGGWGTLAHVPLPAFTLSLPFAAYVARLTYIGMLDVLGSDFVRTALAKGVGRRVVVWKHAFKPAFLPVLSFLGPAAAQAMTGSFVVEKVFGVPGLGQHFVDGALNLDRGLIMSTVLVFSVILVAFNTLVDVVYGLIDPRIAKVG
ncbi:MAG: ABC transporter permease [Phycisphaerae bacterium]|nr:ABC transporter permease [Phycisphaerae bacterium]